MTTEAVALRHLDDAEWVAHKVEGLPARWQQIITRTHQRASKSGERQAANLTVLRAVRDLGDAAKTGLRLDASDNEIRARAVVMARHYVAVETKAKANTSTTVVSKVEGRKLAWTHTPPTLPACPPWLRARIDLIESGMGQFWPATAKTGETALKRLQCEAFWRRTLRKAFGQTVEACSIKLGLVQRRRECYVSQLSVKRRRAQLATNAAMMERTELENEDGQRYTLAQLAGKSTANKQVRRAELMTRISGFEKVAKRLGHAATFITITCPSRMHQWSDLKTCVVRNQKYDGTTPTEAQKYLSGQWAKFRAAAARKGVQLYGFRVAEPHHDGCPHWHALFFHQAAAAGALAALLRTYYLMNESPTERGAAEHRVKLTAINPALGTAAGYITKYIAKNIDGHMVGTDLNGRDATESAERVDAWASTWRIRQFQQIGGSPVSVWRELRRINPDAVPMELMPDTMAGAMRAVSIGETGSLWADGWADYVELQGGPVAKRKQHAIRLMKQETGEFGRYGEVRPADVIGVEACGVNLYLPKHFAHLVGADKGFHRVKRPALARVQSERSTWRNVTSGQVSAPACGEAVRPWTRVNNCTQEVVLDGRTWLFVQRGRVGHSKKWGGGSFERAPELAGQSRNLEKWSL